MVGVGAMIGAGVFAAPGPAAAAAGSWMLAGLAIAAIVAYANATSSAQLAAVHPEAGGAYVYARERLGAYWGFLAGWSFVVGNTAALAAMALTFGAYVHEPLARPIGIAAVLGLTAVNYFGVGKSARLTRIIVAVGLACLATAVAAAALGGGTSSANFTGDLPAGPWGILQSAGFLFFAFAGYARLATLGEEVRDPEVVIPRAIPLALGIVVVVYTIVLAAALAAVGPRAARRRAGTSRRRRKKRWGTSLQANRTGILGNDTTPASAGREYTGLMKLPEWSAALHQKPNCHDSRPVFTSENTGAVGSRRRYEPNRTSSCSRSQLRPERPHLAPLACRSRAPSEIDAVSPYERENERWS